MAGDGFRTASSTGPTSTIAKAIQAQQQEVAVTETGQLVGAGWTAWSAAYSRRGRARRER
ncbi:hypothetical protein [Streptomyces paradoxus]|uniref:hypothetical protein n=1 Tax=Streptomyces paradoxus TaxID=66375 RepID=UPI0037CE100F